MVCKLGGFQAIKSCSEPLFDKPYLGRLGWSQTDRLPAVRRDPLGTASEEPTYVFYGVGDIAEPTVDAG